MAIFETLTVGRLKANDIQATRDAFTKWRFGQAMAAACTNSSATTNIPVNANFAGSLNPTLVTYGAVNASTAKRILKCALPVSGVAVLTAGASTATGDIMNMAVLAKGGGQAPAYDIFAAGILSTGTSAAPTATIAGALATDIPLVMKKTTAGTARLVDAAVMTANTLTLTLAAAATVTHDYYYVILRQAGSFVPSHKIVAAGYSAFVPAAAAGTITITGAKAGDICVASVNLTNQTNELLYGALTANTLTLTCAGDPGTAGVSYVVARKA